MYERKASVQANRLRRRVKALEERDASWPWRARARKQLRKVEAKTTRTVKE